MADALREFQDLDQIDTVPAIKRPASSGENIELVIDNEKVHLNFSIRGSLCSSFEVGHYETLSGTTIEHATSADISNDLRHHTSEKLTKHIRSMAQATYKEAAAFLFGRLICKKSIVARAQDDTDTLSNLDLASMKVYILFFKAVSVAVHAVGANVMLQKAATDPRPTAMDWRPATINACYAACALLAHTVLDHLLVPYETSLQRGIDLQIQWLLAFLRGKLRRLSGSYTDECLALDHARRLMGSMNTELENGGDIFFDAREDLFDSKELSSDEGGEGGEDIC